MGSLKMSDPQWIECTVRRPVLCKSHAVLCCWGLVKRTYQHRRGAFLFSLKTGNKISEFQFQLESFGGSSCHGDSWPAEEL